MLSPDLRYNKGMAYLPLPPKEAIIYEDDDVFVCVADHPITKGHCRVIWKHPATNLSQLGQNEYLHLMRVVDQARNALAATLGAENIYLLFMDETDQAHWDLVPRYNTKGLNIFLHKPQKRYDLEVAKAVRQNWGNSVFVPKNDSRNKSKGRFAGLRGSIYFKSALVFLLLTAATLTFSQYKADSLMQKGARQDRGQQYVQAAQTLSDANGFIALPGTQNAIKAEEDKNGRWQTDAIELNKADSLQKSGQYVKALHLLEAVSADFPGYPAAQSKMKEVASHVPATASSFTNPNLVVVNDYCAVDATRAPDLIDTAIKLALTCQSTYPKIENLLQPSAYLPPHRVYFQNLAGTSYGEGGYEEGGNVYLSISYFRNHPNDVGILVHELTHVTQSYPAGPQWVKEGIADYARLELGYKTSTYNYGCNGSSNYGSGYTCSAALLKFIERKYDGGIVKTLDARMRAGTYSDAFFLYRTGLNLNQLYKACLSADCKGGQKL
ncbi:MAG: Peptidase of plants and bacteria [Candidatus Saccharibacteria bacterium]|nr:Peptidase of plants and bacteria [Candidatus Saccharibacteria bacterium]